MPTSLELLRALSEVEPPLSYIAYSFGLILGVAVAWRWVGSADAIRERPLSSLFLVLVTAELVRVAASGALDGFLSVLELGEVLEGFDLVDVTGVLEPADTTSDLQPGESTAHWSWFHLILFMVYSLVGPVTGLVVGISLWRGTGPLNLSVSRQGRGVGALVAAAASIAWTTGPPSPPRQHFRIFEIDRSGMAPSDLSSYSSIFAVPTSPWTDAVRTVNEIANDGHLAIGLLALALLLAYRSVPSASGDGVEHRLAWGGWTLSFGGLLLLSLRALVDFVASSISLVFLWLSAHVTVGGPIHPALAANMPLSGSELLALILALVWTAGIFLIPVPNRSEIRRRFTHGILGLAAFLAVWHLAAGGLEPWVHGYLTLVPQPVEVAVLGLVLAGLVWLLFIYDPNPDLRPTHGNARQMSDTGGTAVSSTSNHETSNPPP